MDQRSTKASATSQRTMNGALIQSKLCGSFAHKKGYYFFLFLHLNHITTVFLLLFFVLLAAGKPIIIISETTCLGHYGFDFLYCKKKQSIEEKGSPGCLTRQSLDETQRGENTARQQQSRRNDWGKNYGAWGKIKREKEGEKWRKDCRRGRRERKVVLQHTIEQ